MHMPEDTRAERAQTMDAELYVRSYLLMRTVVGVVGIALPVALVVGDLAFLSGGAARGSMSAYYHSGMRDVFVGSLCVIGVSLVVYKVFSRNLENGLTAVAGAAAIGVALFPTSGGSPLTPLQERWGEGLVAAVHFGCAAVFILLLAVISRWFGRREGTRDDRTAAQRARWRRFHLTCSWVIFAAVAFIVVTKALRVLDDYSLYVGEAVAGIAFGASWLAKGLEVDVLLGRRPAPSEAVTG